MTYNMGSYNRLVICSCLQLHQSVWPQLVAALVKIRTANLVTDHACMMDSQESDAY